MTEFGRSPLSQTVTRDGKNFRINIYADGEGGWCLEMTDDNWNAIAWDDVFATEQAALAMALKTIEREGSAMLAGVPRELLEQ